MTDGVRLSELLPNNLDGLEKVIEVRVIANRKTAKENSAVLQQFALDELDVVGGPADQVDAVEIRLHDEWQWSTTGQEARRDDILFGETERARRN